MVPVGGCVCDEGYEQNVNGSACLGKTDSEFCSRFKGLVCTIFKEAHLTLCFVFRALSKGLPKRKEERKNGKFKPLLPFVSS